MWRKRRDYLSKKEGGWNPYADGTRYSQNRLSRYPIGKYNNIQILQASRFQQTHQNQPTRSNFTEHTKDVCSLTNWGADKCWAAGALGKAFSKLTLYDRFHHSLDSRGDIRLSQITQLIHERGGFRFRLGELTPNSAED